MTSSRPIVEWAQQALEAVNAPLAVLEGRDLVWSNDAMQRLADERGVSVQDACRLPGFEFRSLGGIDGTSDLQLCDGAEIAAAVSDAARPIDATTGTLRREAILEAGTRWFANRSQRHFALVFADLDDFKRVNDRWGHAAGDACLAAVGRRLALAVRSGDLVGRYGGDEFLVLLATDRREAVAAVVERLRAAVAEPIRLDSLAVVGEPEVAGGPSTGGDAIAQVRLSVGVAMSSEEHESWDAMLRHADRGMYRHKRGGVADSARLG